MATLKLKHIFAFKNIVITTKRNLQDMPIELDGDDIVNILKQLKCILQNESENK